MVDPPLHLPRALALVRPSVRERRLVHPEPRRPHLLDSPVERHRRGRDRGAHRPPDLALAPSPRPGRQASGEEAPGVASIVLVRAPPRPAPRRWRGQYFGSALPTSPRGLWWRAHPYSLSAVPVPPYLRITVKGAGRTSGMLGPSRRRSAPVSLSNGRLGRSPTGYGAPITRCSSPAASASHRSAPSSRPSRRGVRTSTLIMRGARPEDLLVPLRARAVSRTSQAPHRRARREPRHDHLLGADDVRRLVPDLADSDVYVCGPEGFTRHIEQVALALGTPKGSVHRESFSY